MADGLKASSLIRVNSSIAAEGLVVRETGRTLLLTTDKTIPPNKRVRVYSTIDEISADFSVDSKPYEAGNIYFSQSPFPKNFLVGSYFDSAGAGYLRGGSSIAALSAFQAISDGSFTMKLGTVAEYADSPTENLTVTGIDLSGAASLTDVASAIESAISATSPSQTITFSYVAENNGFEMSFEEASLKIGAGYLESTPAGTDISELLAMTVGLADTLAYSYQPETVEEALVAITDIDSSITFICEDHDISDTTDVGDIAAWCLANRIYIHIASSSNPNDKAGIAGTEFDKIYTTQNGNCLGIWSSIEDYKHVSAASRLSSINFSQSNSLITLMYKQAPGCTPDSLTTNSASKLKAKNINWYSTRSSVPMFEDGKTFDNDFWIDIKFWLIWFENAVLTAVFNLLYSSGKVSQTEVGMSLIKNAITKVCEQGVANGGIAPGQLSDATTNDIQLSTGNSSFDGYLSSGYMIYSDAIASQSQSDRNQRLGTPVKVWLKGAGAIHEVDVAIVYEQ